MKNIFVVLSAVLLCLSTSASLRAQAAKTESVGGKTFATEDDKSPGSETVQDAHVSTQPSADSAGARSDAQYGKGWRYQWYKGRWWYWTEKDRWVYWSGDRWITYPGVRHTTAMRPVAISPNRYLPGMETPAAYGRGGSFGGNLPTHFVDSDQGGNYEPNAGHSSGYTWGDSGRTWNGTQ